jgi:serine/threonine protein kinase
VGHSIGLFRGTSIDDFYEIRQALIRSMISLDPSHRLTCSEYLAQYRRTAFPDIFYTFLHPFLSSLNEASIASRPTPPNYRPSFGIGSNTTPRQQYSHGGSSDADDKIERIWTDWETISGFLDGGRVITKDLEVPLEHIGITKVNLAECSRDYHRADIWTRPTVDISIEIEFAGTRR